ncbi:MAG: SDR family oxidoreductase [Pseudomonadota bacterium]|nr:SDR family oxidoreductase [Pseudomonadota bacterium]
MKSKDKPKMAVVTGGSSGIGKAVCLALAGSGMSVVAVGRHEERLSSVVSAMQEVNSCPEAFYYGLSLDVTREQDMDQLRQMINDKFGGVDVLIAAAGIGRSSGSDHLIPESTSQLSFAEWQEVISVNLNGVFLANRAVLPCMMRRKKGIIINISSYPAGLEGQPYAPAYSASKFGVAGLTESLAAEMRPYGIKIHALFPGLTETPMTEGTALQSRFGPSLRPESVADFILYLVSLPENVNISMPVIRPFM